MAYFFADSFDLYSAVVDMSSYWDIAGTSGSITLVAGRFSGNRAVSWTSSNDILQKNSGANDTVHHLTFAFRTTWGSGGTNLGLFFQFSDSATNQCAVVFRTDGAILLTSGSPTGTALATYLNAHNSNVWTAFEIEVVIHPSAGSFTVRKNGNPANDFSATGLNTRPGANTYANRLTINEQTNINSNQIDDLLWRSDATTVPWSGDARCYPRMPTTDASAQFARVPAGAITQTVPAAMTTTGGGTNVAYYTQFTAAYNGTVTAVAASVNAVGGASSLKCAIYADSGSNLPGAILASADAAVFPIVGSVNFAFTPGVAIVKGGKYWVAAVANASGFAFNAATTSAIGASGSVAFASFPQATPVVSNPITPAQFMWTYTITSGNSQAVSEAQQDGTTSYVYDATPGHADFYNLDQIATPSVQRLGLVTRGFVAKGDAGTRSGTMQLKSGASTVAAPTLVLSSSWLWSYRTDTVNPATGTAWTDATANAVTAGPAVVA